MNKPTPTPEPLNRPSANDLERQRIEKEIAADYDKCVFWLFLIVISLSLAIILPAIMR